MKFLLLVISILPHWAFSQSLTWSPKWVQVFNNKTAFEMCKASSLNVKHACVALKVTQQKTTKFQFKLETDNSLIVSYKGYSTRLERTSNPQIFKVNRKDLNLSETTNALELQEKIIQRLPSPKASLSLWVSQAYANPVFPHSEMGTAITFMLMAQQEQEICQSADKIIKSCKMFNAEFIEKMKSLTLQKPEELEALKIHQKDLRNARMIFSQTTNFHLMLSSLDAQKTSMISKCDCKNGICGMQEKETEFGVSFDICKSNIKIIHEISKRYPKLDKHITELSNAIYEIEEKNAPKPPPDSLNPFKAGNQSGEPSVR